MGSGTVTVVPLTSPKENKSYHSSTVNIGEEIYLNLKKKFEFADKKLSAEATEVIALKDEFDTLNEEDRKRFYQKLNKAMEDLKFTEKIQEEIDRMKQGSIACVGQITTISKQRIYDPQRYRDIMSGVKISSISLTLIDNKIKELFLKS